MDIANIVFPSDTFRMKYWGPWHNTQIRRGLDNRSTLSLDIASIVFLLLVETDWLTDDMYMCRFELSKWRVCVVDPVSGNSSGTLFTIIFWYSRHSSSCLPELPFQRQANCVSELPNVTSKSEASRKHATTSLTMANNWRRELRMSKTALKSQASIEKGRSGRGYYIKLLYMTQQRQQKLTLS